MQCKKSTACVDHALDARIVKRVHQFGPNANSHRVDIFYVPSSGAISDVPSVSTDKVARKKRTIVFIGGGGWQGFDRLHDHEPIARKLLKTRVPSATGHPDTVVDNGQERERRVLDDAVVVVLHHRAAKLDSLWLLIVASIAALTPCVIVWSTYLALSYGVYPAIALLAWVLRAILSALFPLELAGLTLLADKTYSVGIALHNATLTVLGVYGDTVRGVWNWAKFFHASIAPIAPEWLSWPIMIGSIVLTIYLLRSLFTRAWHLGSSGTDPKCGSRLAVPGLVLDIAGGLRALQDILPLYDADPYEMMLIGNSSGAHLAAQVAFDPRWLRMAGVHPILNTQLHPYLSPRPPRPLISHLVLISPPTHFSALPWWYRAVFAAVFGSLAALRDASPNLYLKPPFRGPVQTFGTSKPVRERTARPSVWTIAKEVVAILFSPTISSPHISDGIRSLEVTKETSDKPESILKPTMQTLRNAAQTAKSLVFETSAQALLANLGLAFNRTQTEPPSEQSSLASSPVQSSYPPTASEGELPSRSCPGSSSSQISPDTDASKNRHEGPETDVDDEAIIPPLNPPTIDFGEHSERERRARPSCPRSPKFKSTVYHSPVHRLFCEPITQPTELPVLNSSIPTEHFKIKSKERLPVENAVTTTPAKKTARSVSSGTTASGFARYSLSTSLPSDSPSVSSSPSSPDSPTSDQPLESPALNQRFSEASSTLRTSRSGESLISNVPTSVDSYYIDRDGELDDSHSILSPIYRSGFTASRILLTNNLPPSHELPIKLKTVPEHVISAKRRHIKEKPGESKIEGLRRRRGGDAAVNDSSAEDTDEENEDDDKYDVTSINSKNGRAHQKSTDEHICTCTSLWFQPVSLPRVAIVTASFELPLFQRMADCLFNDLYELILSASSSDPLPLANLVLREEDRGQMDATTGESGAELPLPLPTHPFDTILTRPSLLAHRVHDNGTGSKPSERHDAVAPKAPDPASAAFVAAASAAAAAAPVALAAGSLAGSLCARCGAPVIVRSHLHRSHHFNAVPEFANSEFTNILKLWPDFLRGPLTTNETDPYRDVLHLPRPLGQSLIQSPSNDPSAPTTFDFASGLLASDPNIPFVMPSPERRRTLTDATQPLSPTTNDLAALRRDSIRLLKGSSGFLNHLGRRPSHVFRSPITESHPVLIPRKPSLLLPFEKGKAAEPLILDQTESVTSSNSVDIRKDAQGASAGWTHVPVSHPMHPMDSAMLSMGFMIVLKLDLSPPKGQVLQANLMTLDSQFPLRLPAIASNSYSTGLSTLRNEIHKTVSTPDASVFRSVPVRIGTRHYWVVTVADAFSVRDHVTTWRFALRFDKALAKAEAEEWREWQQYQAAHMHSNGADSQDSFASDKEKSTRSETLPYACILSRLEYSLAFGKLDEGYSRQAEDLTQFEFSGDWRSATKEELRRLHRIRRARVAEVHASSLHDPSRFLEITDSSANGTRVKKIHHTEDADECLAVVQAPSLTPTVQELLAASEAVVSRARHRPLPGERPLWRVIQLVGLPEFLPSEPKDLLCTSYPTRTSLLVTADHCMGDGTFIMGCLSPIISLPLHDDDKPQQNTKGLEHSSPPTDEHKVLVETINHGDKAQIPLLLQLWSTCIVGPIASACDLVYTILACANGQRLRNPLLTWLQVERDLWVDTRARFMSPTYHLRLVPTEADTTQGANQMKPLRSQDPPPLTTKLGRALASAALQMGSWAPLLPLGFTLKESDQMTGELVASNEPKSGTPVEVLYTQSEALFSDSSYLTGCLTLMHTPDSDYQALFRGTETNFIGLSPIALADPRLKIIRKNLGATINDIIVTAITIVLYRYKLRATGESTKSPSDSLDQIVETLQSAQKRAQLQRAVGISIPVMFGHPPPASVKNAAREYQHLFLDKSASTLEGQAMVLDVILSNSKTSHLQSAQQLNSHCGNRISMLPVSIPFEDTSSLTNLALSIMTAVKKRVSAAKRNFEPWGRYIVSLLPLYIMSPAVTRAIVTFLNCTSIAGVSNFRGLSELQRVQNMQRALRARRLELKRLAEKDPTAPEVPRLLLEHWKDMDDDGFLPGEVRPISFTLERAYNWGLYRYVPFLIGATTVGDYIYISISHFVGCPWEEVSHTSRAFTTPAKETFDKDFNDVLNCLAEFATSKAGK